MLVSALITSAMRKNTLIASGETPTPSEYADGLEALQVMIRSWAAVRQNIFASSKESFSLSPSTASYTWGSGGVIATARPKQIVGAYVLDANGGSNPVRLIDEDKYRSITVKTTPGRPDRIFLHQTYPLATLYVYPVPEVAEVMWIDSYKQFTETGSFDLTTSTLAFPDEYQEAMIYNLATRIASEFGKTIPPEVAAIAKASRDRVSILNAANQVKSIDLSLPVYASSFYNINTDSSR